MEGIAFALVGGGGKQQQVGGGFGQTLAQLVAGDLIGTAAESMGLINVSALESASVFPKISSSHLKSITSSLDFHYDHSRTC